jgi:nucleotide-binding universal stress UspA family protein
MRVLIATDGSLDAKNAADWVRHLPLPADTRYRVISVVPSSTLPDVPDLDDRARDMARRAAEAVVEETRGHLGLGAVEGGVAEGDAREGIVTAAADWGADLVVMGARGLGAVKEFLLGSVSLDVARHAPCPVLVCKGTPRDVRTMTIAHDGSTGAAAAVRFVDGLRLPHHAHLRVVGVAEPVRYPTAAPGIIGKALHAAIAQVEAERTARLEATLKPAIVDLWSRVATVDLTVTVGSPAPEILRCAEASDTDLIVVGARGLGTMTRLLLGSVSESVLRHASCPVLVVRERA